MTFPALPAVMVAPNGARRTKADHPRLPMKVEETIAEAVDCFRAGADGLHAHVRDADGRHVLDAGLYRELLAGMADACPSMLVQITTEAVGRYSPQEQEALVRAVRPRAVSIALREMLPEEAGRDARIYWECRDEGIAVQHILYAHEEMVRLAGLVDDGTLPDAPQLLFVLGRYTAGRTSSPDMLDPFVEAMRQSGIECDWAVCAFGQGEFACLTRAIELGGKVRIGFENNILAPDGSPAVSNAGQVETLFALTGMKKGRSVSSRE